MADGWNWLTIAKAETSFGRYTLDKHDKGFLRVMFGNQRIGHFDDDRRDEAKAAAQAHHDAVIRSCLLDKPEAGEGVDWGQKSFDTATEILTYLGIGTEASGDPGIDRRRDRICRIIETALSTPADTEAAAEIDRLRRELEEARRALRQMRCPRPCNHQPEDLDAGDCIDAGECGCIDGQFRDALIAGALQRADAREKLFPEMSSRIKAEREQARRQAFEEAAELIEANIIKDSSAGKFLAPRQEGNRDGLHYAAAIRQRAEEEGR
ncbi:hypothetical protein GOB33_22395 [Sinorhizobium meliloti]|nr:hypothetical protein [Sinorhizobium meliloti]